MSALPSLERPFRAHCDECEWRSEFLDLEGVLAWRDAPCPQCGVAPVLNADEADAAEALWWLHEAARDVAEAAGGRVAPAEGAGDGLTVRVACGRDKPEPPR